MRGGAVSGRASAAYSREAWARSQGFDLADYYCGREYRQTRPGAIYRRFYGPDAERKAAADERRNG
jgi:hypothetical protein